MMSTLGNILFLLLVPGQGLAEAAGPPRPIQGVMDVLREASPDGRGIEEAYAWVSRFRKVVHTLEVTKSASRAYRFMDEAIENVDFDAVFETPLAYRLRSRSRLFSVIGAERDQRYIVDYRRGPTSVKDVAGPLSFATGVTFSDLADPLPDESRGIGISTQLDVNAGELSHRTLGRYWGGLLKLVEATDIQPFARVAHDRGQSILRDFRKTLPRSWALLDAYFQVTPRLERRRAAAKSWWQASNTIVLNVPALKRDYRHLGGYLEGLIDALELKARVSYKQAQGFEYAAVTVDGPRRQMTLECLTDDGRIVPRDAEGKPKFSASFDPAILKEQKGEVVVAFSAKIMGITLQIQDLLWDLSYADGPEALFSAKLRSVSPPKVSGALAGFFPPWAIDVMIPGSMEGYAKTFFDGLLKAKGGQGTFVTTKVRGSSHGNLVSSRGGTVMIDNTFLLMGLRMVQENLWPNEAVTDDLGKIVVKGVDAFYEDLSLLRTESVSH